MKFRSFSLAVLSILLLPACLYLNEKVSSTSSGFEKLTEKKEEIIKSWNKDHQYRLQNKPEKVLMSKLAL